LILSGGCEQIMRRTGGPRIDVDQAVLAHRFATTPARICGRRDSNPHGRKAKAF
jgi:hypothetical protein